MAIEIGKRKMPEVRIRLPGDIEHALLITGPAAAKFYRLAVDALGYPGTPVQKFLRLIAENNAAWRAELLKAEKEERDPDFDPDAMFPNESAEKKVAAVDAMIPDDWNIKGQLAAHEYMTIFNELFWKTLDEFIDEAGEDLPEKKDNGSAPQ